jgi:hypothetical protein
MIGKAANSKIRSTALGLQFQSSVYGSAIPLIYGRTRCPLSMTWAKNLRESENSSKKGKGSTGGKKSGGDAPTYSENLDFLIGCNPIVAPLQFWQNREQRYLLNFPVVTFTKAAFDSQEVTVADELFYCVISVTISGSYDTTFDEYGNPEGARNVAGDWEIPLWNMATIGPDSVNPKSYRNWPYCYYWLPGDPLILIPAIELGLISGTVTVNYAQATSQGTPIAQLNLEFESQLGNGSEYTDYEEERIIYPPYAGLGSPNFDLGSSSAVPSIRAEILGSYNLYTDGDADLADIVEDVFRSGMAQAAYDNTPLITQIQRGLGCYDFPGTIQKKAMSSTDAGALPLTSPQFELGSQSGDVLILTASALSGWSAAAALSGGASWVSVVPDQRAMQRQFWYGIAGDSPAFTSSLNIDGTDGEVQIFEISGVQEFDAVVVTQSTGASGLTSISASITTTNTAMYPEYIMSWLFFGGVSSPEYMNPRPPLKTLLSPTQSQRSDYCIVYYPATYTFTYDFIGTEIPDTQEWTWVLIAFKRTDPPNYSKPLGDILDSTTLEQCRLQCRANGLWGSLAMDSQKAAKDWLSDLYFAMNSVPVWSGFKLKSIPLSEVSQAGNGAIYVPATAGGPVAELTENDFVAGPGEPVVTIERKARVDSLNLLQVQHPNRTSEYNDIIVTAPEQTAITAYGLRRDSPKQLRCIQDRLIAAKILAVMIRRENYIRVTYKFKLKANWKLLEPMDLVTLTDPLMGIENVPVRLTGIEEDENFQLDCEAEPYIFGVHAPVYVGVNEHVPYIPSVGVIPNPILDVFIFETTEEFTAAGLQYGPQIWMAIPNSDVNYGGCMVYMSIDGGVHYDQIGTIWGKAIAGDLIGTVYPYVWPITADPDTTDDAEVDTTRGGRGLTSHTSYEADSYLYPCIVESAGGSPLYEIINYTTVQQTDENEYLLKATGAGNQIRRGLFGSAIATHGYPLSTRFASLKDGGVFKHDLPESLIGTELYFKFRCFNTFGSGLEDISDSYIKTFTPQGIY